MKRHRRREVKDEDYGVGIAFLDLHCFSLSSGLIDTPALPCPPFLGITSEKGRIIRRRKRVIACFIGRQRSKEMAVLQRDSSNVSLCCRYGSDVGIHSNLGGRARLFYYRYYLSIPRTIPSFHRQGAYIFRYLLRFLFIFLQTYFLRDELVSIRIISQYLKRNEQPALFEALLKLKEELMLLGFISLLLTVFQGVISNICISPNLYSHMLACKRVESPTAIPVSHKRILSQSSSSLHCSNRGKIPLLSLEALHQLHIFIFVLAVVHVLFCAATMILGGAKIKKWKHWEDSIKNENLMHHKSRLFIYLTTLLHISYLVTELSSDKNHRHAHLHRDFVKKRGSGHWRKTPVVGWTTSFVKQFYASVTKSDYLALRSGFIMKHCRSNVNFDFHKYMMRTLEADFKKVVGISWYLWAFVVIFLLLNVDGWHAYFWLSFLPLMLLLAVGAKLENIITHLAQEAASSQRTEGEEEIQITPSDQLFWFHKPGIILYLIHFILFQNSFEIAFFFWILTTYGFDSCIMGEVGYIIPRLIIGVIVQVLCSYSTLPLYAIVTQMGDNFKRQIFDDQMRDKIQGWAMSVRGKRKPGTEGSSSSVSRRDEEARLDSHSVPTSQHSVAVGQVAVPIL